MKKARRPRAASKLTERNRDRAAAEFDREFVADTFGPLTPRARARWQRAKRKRGRPRVGAGAAPITVTIEKTLLRQVDRVVKLRRTTRAALIARGLRRVVREELTAVQ
jgi:hypothetical protein